MCKVFYKSYKFLLNYSNLLRGPFFSKTVYLLTPSFKFYKQFRDNNNITVFRIQIQFY